VWWICAGDVTYETKTGFLDRNKDVLVPAHPLILQASSNTFVKVRQSPPVITIT
jgi:myosin heavy subunit